MSILRNVLKWWRRTERSSRSIASVLFRPKFELLENRILLAVGIFESFENGLSADWTITSVDPDARVEIRDLATEGIITDGPSLAFTQNGNNNALTFDSSQQSGDTVKDLGLAIWSVDLSSFSDAIFTFHHFEVGDENDPLPDVHVTNAAGDGIAISINGTDWYRLNDQQGQDINRSGDGLWELIEIDLGEEIARINTAFPSANLSFSSDVQFKFSQYDDRALDSLDTDGFAIDELRIQEQADIFTLDRPRGAFNRFNIAGEDDNDYFYRAALFGDVDANTPFLISTHGATREFNYDALARRWHRFVADPANGVDSLIVITPVFPTGGRYDEPDAFSQLSWKTSDTAYADLALLSSVDAIAAEGVGDASGLYMWGFSAGGQFTQRFVAAHPDRVVAAVVGGSSPIFPTESVAWPHGFGDVAATTPPPGVTLDIDDFLQSRVMLWVGENDNDPDDPSLLQDFPSFQGSDRIERFVNVFENMYSTIDERGIVATDYEYELYVAEDESHSWDEDDLPGIYEFLFRERNQTDLPILVHPRIVTTPSVDERSQSLPQNVNQLSTGQPFYVEFWVEAPSGSTTGIQSGQLDFYFDPALATINEENIEHGSVFSVSANHSYDFVEAPAFLRSFTGTTQLSGVGVGDYALFGRVEMTAANPTTNTQLPIALMRSASLDFELEDSSRYRTDFMPSEKTTVVTTGQGVQGVIYEDADTSGVQNASELGLAGRQLELRTAGGSPVTLSRALEPDDFSESSYVDNESPWVELTALGNWVSTPGVVTFESPTQASTGSSVFGNFLSFANSSLWISGLASLRLDFTAPATSVSIDAIGIATNDHVGRLDLFDADNNLLETVTTAALGPGISETLSVTRPGADIAYAIATGDGSAVRLDNLQFDIRPVVTTNAVGEYRFADIDAGTWNVVAEVPLGWNSTLPVSSQQQIVVGNGQLLPEIHFGQARDTTPGILVSPLSGDTSEDGGSATFTVRLRSEPTADVTIAISSDDTTEGMVAVSSLTFTTDNWDLEQTVLVTGVDDFLSDGDVAYMVVTGAASSADLDYDGLDPVDVNVTNIDNDQSPVEFYFSLAIDDFLNSLSLTGDPARNEDIIAFDGSSFSMFFDGSDVGVDGIVDAFSVIGEDEVLLSLSAAALLPGIADMVEPTDIVKFVATSFGENTAGSFEVFFDGSDVGLTAVGENVDAVELLDSGELLISTWVYAWIPGLGVAQDEDVLIFTPTSLGPTTTGTWAYYMDGSDVGLAEDGEDVNALAVDGDGDIYLSSTTGFAVTGISGADEDVFVFHPTSVGPETSGNYDSTLFFDGSTRIPVWNNIFALDLPPRPVLSIDDVTVVEGDSGTVDAVFTVTMSYASDLLVSFDYTTDNGTATAGSDYVADGNTLTFLPGETTGTITVTVNGDMLYEDDETFLVELSNPLNAGIAKGQGIGTANNDDSAPTISIADTTVNEADAISSGTVDAVFTVSLSAAAGRVITVNYTTIDGPGEVGANAPGDYSTISGILTFDPGQTETTILVPVSHDLIDEWDELFLVGLGNSNPASVVITDAVGVATIIDDDAAPSLSIDDVAVNEGDIGASEAVFNVNLSSESGKTITVNFATANITATAGSDYTADVGTIILSPAQTGQTISVQVQGDVLIEGNEVFLVVLANAMQATIADSQGLGTIVEDDDGPSLRVGVISGVSSTAWTTVNLTHTYASMVVIATPNYDAASAPGVARIQNAVGNSFEVRVDSAGGAPTADVDVHYIVVEEGVYDEAGFKMEAIKFDTMLFDRFVSWVGESQAYNQSYDNPVVVGQVMSYNDSGFSVFWARGIDRQSPPSSTELYVGRHVGEDPDWWNRPSVNETIGYLVIEASTDGTGRIEGLPFIAAVGADTTLGIDDAPPYEYSYSALSNAGAAVVSQAGMDGAEGGWAVLYGNEPLPPSGGSLVVAIDEDQLGDAERSHSSEQVAYLIVAPTQNLVANSTIERIDEPRSRAFLLNTEVPSSVGSQTTIYAGKAGITENEFQDPFVTVPGGSFRPPAQRQPEWFSWPPLFVGAPWIGQTLPHAKFQLFDAYSRLGKVGYVGCDCEHNSTDDPQHASLRFHLTDRVFEEFSDLPNDEKEFHRSDKT